MDSPTTSTTINDMEKGIPRRQSTNCSSYRLSIFNNFSSQRLFAVRNMLSWRPWRDETASNEIQTANVRKLEDKHQGYRSLSTFLDSDENFMIYRRFGYLHSRILLRKQDQLRALEKELDKLDDIDANDETETKHKSRRQLMSREVDEAACRKQPADIRTRTDILDDIEKRLDEYDSLVLQAKSMVALNRPAANDHKSVKGWISKKSPLIDEERNFIYEQPDLITLRDGRERALLDSFLEWILRTFPCSLLQNIFCSKIDRERTTDPHLHYYTKSRKDYATTALLTLVLLCLLILPVFLLYRLTIKGGQNTIYTASMGVLLAFTLSFSAVLSLFTKAKRHEIFASAAAYCAVLVVFLSNFPKD